MSQAYTADTPFRLAVSWLLSFSKTKNAVLHFFWEAEGFPVSTPQVMGDSWVTDVKRSRSGHVGHVVRSPLGEALCSVTQTLGAVDPWFCLCVFYEKNPPILRLLGSLWLALSQIGFHDPRSSSLQVSLGPARKICSICEPRQKEASRFAFHNSIGIQIAA